MTNESSARDILSLLADLISINSVNPNYDGGVPELELANYVEEYFVARGIETWQQLVYPDRPNVIARIPGRDSSRRIIFEAHLDTVSAEGMSIAPWSPEIREGKMYGRGSCDTKAGLAAMMHAIANLSTAAFIPAVDVLFAATIDEEYSYRGVVALCKSLNPGTVDRGVIDQEFSPVNSSLRAEAAIIAEPTLLKPVIASKGVVRWKIETRGKSAHSSKPHLGSNAIEHMACIINEIKQDTMALSNYSHRLLGPATCNIGVIRGGTQVNFVPDRCQIEIDRRLLPGEELDEVLAHYQELVDRVAARDSDMDVSMHQPMLCDRPLETDASEPAVQTMVSVLNAMDLDGQLVGVPFCSDASKFGALGIPSMILGPGSIDQAHAAVEFVECEQVVRAAEIYRQFAIQFC